jgi:hypothetical protein
MVTSARRSDVTPRALLACSTTHYFETRYVELST